MESEGSNGRWNTGICGRMEGRSGTCRLLAEDGWVGLVKNVWKGPISSYQFEHMSPNSLEDDLFND